MAWVIQKYPQIPLHFYEFLAERRLELQLVTLVISITCVPEKRLLDKHLEERYQKQRKGIWDLNLPYCLKMPRFAADFHDLI